MTLSLIKNKIIILVILFIFPALSFSQEIITGLYSNPVLKANHIKTNKTKKAKSNMLRLPFFDDFSGTDIYPNDTLWANRYVFINSSYPYLPPTIGVATFDALNDTGAIYATANSYGFTADTLTSNPIRLDDYYASGTWIPLKIKDSVYFSFYYQPQGIGNPPEAGDSLVLMFYAPLTGEWKEVWASPGMTLQQFHTQYNTWFKRVMIPITDSADFFQQGFRFMFYNWASLANSSIPSWASGNVDIWNIDYVYLDRGRSIIDSTYQDIAFINPAPSMLKNYNAMPWSQYKVDTSGEMEDTLNILIHNLDSTTYNFSYEYTVQKENGPWSITYNGGSANILPFSIQTPHPSPPVGFNFPTSRYDSAEFLITHIIKEGLSGDIHRKNDTTIFDQKFYDYYAYDDGTPEAGYGLSPAYSMLAYQFTLNHPDTLRAVDMFFNRTLNNASQQFFHLTVWGDISGYPGDTIYQQKNLLPEYVDSINRFYRYRTDDRIIPLSGTFYVGWVQTTDDNLNLGFDLNNDEHNKIFYNVGSGWSNSNNAGALMIRPVLGKILPLTAGINEISQVAGKIKVYPNPSTGEQINILLPEENLDKSKLKISIYNLMGNEVYKSAFSSKINVSGLESGMYILCISSNDNSSKYFTKLTILK